MFKKIFIIILLTVSCFSILGLESFADVPVLNCVGLPGCVDGKLDAPSTPSLDNNRSMFFITNIIGQVVQYTSAIAVITLILSGFMYLVSGGDDEKVKKAKNWIIWSLIGVFISMSAWGIIGMLNNITIG